jgi:hypothetical protein
MADRNRYVVTATPIIGGVPQHPAKQPYDPMDGGTGILHAVGRAVDDAMRSVRQRGMSFEDPKNVITLRFVEG